jgi:hypothetical protein
VLPLELSPDVHSFRASMGWVGSERLEIEVAEGVGTTIGVRAPFRRARLATGVTFPADDQRQHARGNNGLDIWQY